jgi:hypothetical protein
MQEGGSKERVKERRNKQVNTNKYVLYCKHFKHFGKRQHVILEDILIF